MNHQEPGLLFLTTPMAWEELYSVTNIHCRTYLSPPTSFSQHVGLNKTLGSGLGYCPTVFDIQVQEAAKKTRELEKTASCFLATCAFTCAQARGKNHIR